MEAGPRHIPAEHPLAKKEQGGGRIIAEFELEHPRSFMRIRAASVSASVNGDYYQLWLGPTELEEGETDPHEVTYPYLIVQRDFEMPDHGQCDIETHDERYIDHFRLRLTKLSRTRLAFEIVRKTNSHVEVSFALNASEFEEARHIAEVIFGLREQEPDDDDDAL